MTFPSLTGSVQQNCDVAWNTARSIAGAIKDRANSLRSFSAAGTMTSTQALTFTTFLADMKVQLNACAAVQGIQAYAQAQINDNTINVATEFNNMIAAMDGVVSWVLTNFPKTPTTNELRAATFNVDNSGRTVDVVFSAAATSGLRTQLDALIATIN